MIKVKLQNRCSKNKTIGTIEVIFYLNKEKVHFSTKVKCALKDWSEKSMRVKASDIYSSDKNLILTNILARINNVEVKYRLKDRVLTKEKFLKSYNRPDDFQTFHDYCVDYLHRTRRRLNINTIKLHNSALKKLSYYEPDLYFEQITKDFLEDYLVYLKKDMGNNDNTAHKNLSVIKKYVLQAIREGYMDDNPFSDLSIKRSKPNVVFLEEEELLKFWLLYRDYYLDKKYFTTLQFFLFLCFGSQHVGDAADMRTEQFNNVSFTYFRKKLLNSKPEAVTVPLAMPVRIILADVLGDRDTGKIFDKLPAEQTMNRYLKTIADELNIKKKVTLKTGRHTFATIFLENNPNPKTLQTILGHSDIKQTMSYVHALEKTKQRGISCFDKFISGGKNHH